MRGEKGRRDLAGKPTCRAGRLGVPAARAGRLSFSRLTSSLSLPSFVANGGACYDDCSARGVAQPGRALRSGRRGHRFKSCHPDQLHLGPRRAGPSGPGSRTSQVPGSVMIGALGGRPNRCGRMGGDTSPCVQSRHVTPTFGNQSTRATVAGIVAAKDLFIWQVGDRGS